jgi:hypothetical protein
MDRHIINKNEPLTNVQIDYKELSERKQAYKKQKKYQNKTQTSNTSPKGSINILNVSLLDTIF